MLTTIPKSVVVTEPATEPVTLNEAKKHLEIATSDSAHDVDLVRHIEAARQQWEDDTQEFFISRTMRLTLDSLGEMQFPHRPVTAISSVLYYDANNSQQTLSSSVYQLDTSRNQLRLAYNQSWPTYTTRWDAVEINYTLGSHTDSTTVPGIAKSAILLLIGYYFEQRGDMDRPNDLRAYESLVHKYMRSTYP